MKKLTNKLLLIVLCSTITAPTFTLPPIKVVLKHVTSQLSGKELLNLFGTSCLLEAANAWYRSHYGQDLFNLKIKVEKEDKRPSLKDIVMCMLGGLIVVSYLTR